jgi:hypothetical protein
MTYHPWHGPAGAGPAASWAGGGASDGRRRVRPGGRWPPGDGARRGDAGIGKTRLLAEVSDDARARGLEVVTGTRP